MTVYVVYYIFIILVYGLLYNFDFYLKTRGAGQYVSYNDRSKKYRFDIKWFIIISISALILIFGLRAETMGIDLINVHNTGYLPSFIKINSYSLRELFHDGAFLNFEKGFVIFNKLIGMIAPNCRLFLFACAAVSLIPVGIVIYKYSPMPLLSLIVYMGLPTFVILFSALRQAIAVSVTLLAFHMIRRRKKLLFVLLVFLASTFHSSALIFLIAYPLYYLRSNNSIMAAQVLALPVIWLLRKPLFKIFTKVFYGNYDIDNNGAIGLFIAFTAIFIFGIIYGDRRNSDANGLLNLFWAACAIQSLAGLSYIAGRIGYYFMIYLVLLLPEIFKDMKMTSKPAQRKIIIAAVVICFMAFGYYQIKNTYWSQSYPYVFFWDQKASVY